MPPITIYLRSAGDPSKLHIYPSLDEAIHALRTSADGSLNERTPVRLTIYRDDDTDEIYYALALESDSPDGVSSTIGILPSWQEWYRTEHIRHFSIDRVAH